MKPPTEQSTWKPNALDLRMALSILTCCLVATTLSELGLKFPVGEARLDVIQKMTASISCLLCCQDGLEASRGAGRMRVLVTAVGGATGIAIVALDQLLGQNPGVLAILMGAGAILSLCLCRLAGAPAFNARIGTISFLLVAGTLAGTARIWYAIFRLVSTVFGALVVTLVTKISLRPQSNPH